MYLGRFLLGQEIDIPVHCTKGGVPGAPAAAPLLTVYNDAGTKIVASAKMPPIDQYSVTGYFVYRLRLESLFAAGFYRVSIQYVTTALQLRTHIFQIVAGGDVNGAVLSAYYYQRPHASFLVQKLSSGQRVLARNPKE